jgi:hypothetical protein
LNLIISLSSIIKLQLKVVLKSLGVIQEKKSSIGQCLIRSIFKTLC